MCPDVQCFVVESRYCSDRESIGVGGFAIVREDKFIVFHPSRKIGPVDELVLVGQVFAIVVHVLRTSVTLFILLDAPRCRA